jgi:hypothetical protein
MRLIDQRRTGVLPEHAHAEFAGATLEPCRLTIPAREALLAAGAAIEPVVAPPERDITGRLARSTIPHWRVSLGQRAPRGLVVAQLAGGTALCIRRADEPEWPGAEVPSHWHTLDLTPCPRCGSALVWYEARYVSRGYRVCAGPEHHHWRAAE